MRVTVIRDVTRVSEESDFLGLSLWILFDTTYIYVHWSFTGDVKNTSENWTSRLLHTATVGFFTECYATSRKTGDIPLRLPMVYSIKSSDIGGDIADSCDCIIQVTINASSSETAASMTCSGSSEYMHIMEGAYGHLESVSTYSFICASIRTCQFFSSFMTSRVDARPALSRCHLRKSWAFRITPWVGWNIVCSHCWLGVNRFDFYSSVGKYVHDQLHVEYGDSEKISGNFLLVAKHFYPSSCISSYG